MKGFAEKVGKLAVEAVITRSTNLMKPEGLKDLIKHVDYQSPRLNSSLRVQQGSISDLMSGGKAWLWSFLTSGTRLMRVRNVA
ncbi:hypothetical protein KN1_14180 [Stygiolobus caldivivus]|uniref:Uncharacterized protein n=1 Tax=Stygiolobus caldivivus TaxID=2824673 RepID=A0A8D5U5Y9_9CREN|nr:hypothetical protein KN1_14180 [Stygiolobus caldivivus]